jgi:hypothetical protein
MGDAIAPTATGAADEAFGPDVANVSCTVRACVAAPVASVRPWSSEREDGTILSLPFELVTIRWSTRQLLAWLEDHTIRPHRPRVSNSAAYCTRGMGCTVKYVQWTVPATNKRGCLASEYEQQKTAVLEIFTRSARFLSGKYYSSMK